MAVLLSLVVAATAVQAQSALELGDCRIRAGEGFPGIKARCGTMVRPLDPAASANNADTIELHVAVVPALTLEPENDPFVPIAGGPGQSTIEFYAANSNAFEFIRQSRDILLVDQRGTGRSSPLRCELVDELTGAPYSRDLAIAEARRCLDSLPHDPRFFTTSVAVRDLEAVRNALGYGALNVYGVSYGSRVAQHFTRRFPERTRTVILDGVVPPTLALGPDIALDAQRAMERIFDRCEEDSNCVQRFPDLRERFDELRRSLAESPQDVTIAHPETGIPQTLTFGNEQLAASLRLLSYFPSTVALIPLLIDQGAEGHLQPLAAQHQMIAEGMSDALNGGMHNAVVCTEDAPFYDSESLDRVALANTYIGPDPADALEAICSIWPAGFIDEDFREPLNTDLPVLLLSGDSDPVTPPVYADRAAVELSNARHLTGLMQGHGQATRGCMPKIMGRFVDTGSLSDDDLKPECFSRVFAMPFFVDFSGPSP